MKIKLAIGLALLLATFIWAADTDNFTITVTVDFIDFTLKDAGNTTDYTNWPIGNVNAGSVHTQTTTSGGDHIYVNNLSNVALDFKAYSTSVAPGGCGYGTPTAWTPAASAGTNVYKLELGKGLVGTLPGAFTGITGTTSGTANTYYTTTAGESYHLYTQLTAPTVAADGCQHTITVYVMAVAP